MRPKWSAIITYYNYIPVCSHPGKQRENFYENTLIIGSWISKPLQLMMFTTCPRRCTAHICKLFASRTEYGEIEIGLWCDHCYLCAFWTPFEDDIWMNWMSWMSRMNFAMGDVVEVLNNQISMQLSFLSIWIWISFCGPQLQLNSNETLFRRTVVWAVVNSSSKFSIQLKSVADIKAKFNWIDSTETVWNCCSRFGFQLPVSIGFARWNWNLLT